MYGEAKKLHLIEAILKIENDDLLKEVESIILKSKLVPLPRKSFKLFQGVLTEEEATEFEAAINEGCETISPNDWK